MEILKSNMDISSFNCQIFPVKLRCLQPPKDNLLRALFAAFYSSKKEADGQIFLKDGDILFLSAKVVAIDQGCCIRLETKEEYCNLIQQEADFYLANTLLPDDKNPLDFPFTLKEQTPVPFAGIDQSNGAGWHILWPENLHEIANTLHQAIQAEFGLSKFGLVLTDSSVFPMRRGCIGISIAAVGLKLLHSCIGQKDLFGQKLKFSETNIVDRLTNFATLFMGEGAEQTPAVIMRGVGRFVSNTEDFSKLFIEKEKDFYWPLWKDRS